MRLSTKIYLIALILIVVALIIMGIGLYSVNTLSTVIADTTAASRQETTLSQMDRNLMQRVVAIKDILISTDDAEMQKIVDENFAVTDEGLRKAVEEYRSLMPATAPEEMRSRPARILALWDDFAKATTEAAGLSLKNTTNQAHAIYRAQEALWDDIFVKLSEVRDSVASSGSREVRDLLPAFLTMREDLTYFQLLCMKMIAETDREKVQAIDKTVKRLMANTDNNIQLLIERLPARESEIVKGVFGQLQNRVVKDYAVLLPNAMEDSNGLANRLYNTEGMAAQHAFDDYTNQLIDVAAARQVDLLRSANATVVAVNWAMLVGSIVGLIVGIVFAVATIGSINRTLARIISGLGESSEQVNDAAAQISGASQSLAEGATEQAASLEETSSALEEMASMTRQNADNATKTNDTNRQNNRLITEGSTAVRNMSAAMGEIDDSAEKISRIIKTIEDIAFQTNLLALNAAVEAARAGEAGKGFAVVADEVRNLAQRSAQAARDTTELIEGTVTRVRNGSEIASELEKSFREIEDGSTEVSRLIAEITSATNEQAQGVDQVNTAVAQMDKVTQQNAANAEETASASEELSAQASSLNDMVGELVRMVEGRMRGSVVVGSSQPVPRVAVPSRKVPARVIPTPRAREEKDGIKMLSAEKVIPLSENDVF